MQREEIVEGGGGRLRLWVLRTERNVAPSASPAGDDAQLEEHRIAHKESGDSKEGGPRQRDQERLQEEVLLNGWPNDQWARVRVVLVADPWGGDGGRDRWRNRSRDGSNTRTGDGRPMSIVITVSKTIRRVLEVVWGVVSVVVDVSFDGDSDVVSQSRLAEHGARAGGNESGGGAPSPAPAPASLGIRVVARVD